MLPASFPSYSIFITLFTGYFSSCSHPFCCRLIILYPMVISFTISLSIAKTYILLGMVSKSNKSYSFQTGWDPASYFTSVLNILPPALHWTKGSIFPTASVFLLKSASFIYNFSFPTALGKYMMDSLTRALSPETV